MDTRIALLPEDTWTFIKVSLANGVGLTTACLGMNVCIKSMSEFLAKAPGTRDLLSAELTMGYKSLMTIINNGAADHKLSEWSRGHKQLKDFVLTLNLWEQHCKREDVTPQAVAEAFYTYKHFQEVATVTGHTEPEFYRYILADVNLKTYLILSKFITG